MADMAGCYLPYSNTVETNVPGLLHDSLWFIACHTKKKKKKKEGKRYKSREHLYSCFYHFIISS